MNLQDNTLFLAIKTMLPIIPTSNTRGHIIVARMKNTGSSPIPILSQYPSPNSTINNPKRRLCKTMLSPAPAAPDPVSIMNTFEIFVSFALAASTISVIPNRDNSA